jgi:SAM-dependent methyltransferase
MSLTTSYYERQLKAHIIKTLQQHGIKTFDDVFANSKGAFPDIVYKLLLTLPASKKISRNYSGLRDYSNIIPEANPINFDWRFDKTTISTIVGIAKKKKLKSIVLLGTPSLYEPLKKEGINVFLFDINSVLKKHYLNDEQVVEVDINRIKFISDAKFDGVIIDPPWYPSYFTNWINHAGKLCKPGGQIITTLFQPLLRPKARTELRQIRSLTKRLGPSSHLENAVRYITPLFEREVFNNSNIPVYSNWRVADLLVITKLNEPHWRLVATPQDKWIRLEVGTITIALKLNRSSDSRRLSVRYPYPNEDSLLKSVSARDIKRAKLNFITSRNRGLRIDGIDKVLNAIKDLASGSSRRTALRKLKLSTQEKQEMEKVFDTLIR